MYFNGILFFLSRTTGSLKSCQPFAYGIAYQANVTLARFGYKFIDDMSFIADLTLSIVAFLIGTELTWS